MPSRKSEAARPTVKLAVLSVHRVKVLFKSILLAAAAFPHQSCKKGRIVHTKEMSDRLGTVRCTYKNTPVWTQAGDRVGWSTSTTHRRRPTQHAHSIRASANLQGCRTLWAGVWPVPIMNLQIESSIRATQEKLECPHHRHMHNMRAFMTYKKKPLGLTQVSIQTPRSKNHRAPIIHASDKKESCSAPECSSCAFGSTRTILTWRFRSPL